MYGKQQCMNGILRSSLTRILRSSSILLKCSRCRESYNNIPIAGRPPLRLLILSTHYVDSWRLRPWQQQCFHHHYHSPSSQFIFFIVNPPHHRHHPSHPFHHLDCEREGGGGDFITAPHPIPQMLATLKYRQTLQSTMVQCNTQIHKCKIHKCWQHSNTDRHSGATLVQHSNTDRDSRALRCSATLL